ncbi:hypothetical protein [Segatella copri]|uniref:hypothetical protein n=1 Tax=Segatella copri TaxID=165179 RepID=UPI002232A5AF|nr:hypothetical protein [Segatella copri]MCW4074777.1 hypothetical protein [Segatella copri]
MKKYIFLAASALTLASCTSDDFLGNTPENVQSNTSAINFDGGTGKISRTATQTGENAATSLGNNYVVVGFKGNDTTKANATTYAFDHYNVNYKKQTAGTTTSNTADWEYVGQDMKVKGTNPAAALAEKAQTQTIKYWDNSCSSYDFLAFSMGKGYGEGEAKKYATPTAVKKDKLSSEAYTLTGDVNTLGECYISDMATVVKGEKGYSNKAVNMQFRHASSKVRIALYEIVPGYVISDVKFHTDSYSNGESEGQTKGVLYGTFNNAGTLTVSFPTTGTNNNSKSDYNKAHVSFSPEATNGTVNKVEFDNVNYECQKEDQIADKSEFLSQSAATPSYCGGYINVLPAETNSSPANLRIDYKLTATDGSDEVINVKNATVTVPAKYTAWKHGYAYTYIFKISQNTNGTTGKPGSDDTGLTAISFDAVVLDDEETGKQETITTVSDPSITTYGFKDGKVTTGKDEDEDEYEYETGTDIYATAFVPAYTDEENVKHDATTAAPQALYTVTIEPGAAQTINEASIANALTKQPDQTNGNTWTITDANNKKMIITKVTTGTENVTSVPTEDGHNLEVNALKWTGTASTIYAVEYTYGDNKDKKAYKIVTVK